jgi:sporulation protein YlmC with PRC-barrel domain
MLPKPLQRRQPTILAKKAIALEQTKSLRDYLGKRVFSLGGSHVGRIHDVLLKDEELAGFRVRGRHALYIDKEYCDLNSIEAMVLTIDPVTLHIGKHVFDSEGRKLGKVKSIQRDNTKNDCTFLIVKKNLFTKPQAIAYSEVEVAKKNIILSKSHAEK